MLVPPSQSNQIEKEKTASHRRTQDRKPEKVCRKSKIRIHLMLIWSKETSKWSPALVDKRGGHCSVG